MTYLCNQCEYEATQPSSLIVHKNSRHERVRYLCDRCEYKATTQSDLAKHKKLIHNGLKYNCNQCEYIGTGHSTLITHKKSRHQGVKYLCDKCGYNCAIRNRFGSHIQYLHVWTDHMKPDVPVNYFSVRSMTMTYLPRLLKCGLRHSLFKAVGGLSHCHFC